MRVGEFNVEAYSPQEGDVLIVQSDTRLPSSVIMRIREKLRKLFPGHEALIFDGGLTFKVVRKKP